MHPHASVVSALTYREILMRGQDQPECSVNAEVSVPQGSVELKTFLLFSAEDDTIAHSFTCLQILVLETSLVNFYDEFLSHTEKLL